MMNWYDNGWGSGGWLPMSLMMLFWLAVIGFAVWAATRLLRADKPSTHVAESPRLILDRRFAAGEITADQYAQMRRLLSHGATSGDSPGTEHPA